MAPIFFSCAVSLLNKNIQVEQIVPPPSAAPFRSESSSSIVPTTSTIKKKPKAYVVPWKSSPSPSPSAMKIQKEYIQSPSKIPVLLAPSTFENASSKKSLDTNGSSSISPSFAPSRRNYLPTSEDASSKKKSLDTSGSPSIIPSLAPSRRYYLPTSEDAPSKKSSPPTSSIVDNDVSEDTESMNRPYYTTDIGEKGNTSLSPPSYMPSTSTSIKPSKKTSSDGASPTKKPHHDKHLKSMVPSSSPPSLSLSVPPQSSSNASNISTCTVQEGSDLLYYGRETDHILPIVIQYELYFLDRMDDVLKFLYEIELFTLNFIVQSNEFFPNCRNNRSGGTTSSRYLEESLREVGITSYPVDYGIIGSSKLITMKLSFFRS